jgi:hypothetical protein
LDDHLINIFSNASRHSFFSTTTSGDSGDVESPFTLLSSTGVKLQFFLHIV